MSHIGVLIRLHVILLSASSASVNAGVWGNASNGSHRHRRPRTAAFGGADGGMVCVGYLFVRGGAQPASEGTEMPMEPRDDGVAADEEEIVLDLRRNDGESARNERGTPDKDSATHFDPTLPLDAAEDSNVQKRVRAKMIRRGRRRTKEQWTTKASKKGTRWKQKAARLRGGRERMKQFSVWTNHTTAVARRQFLDSIAVVSQALLKSERDAAVVSNETDHNDDVAGHDLEVTHQSDLTLPGRRMVVVTTAALPWMTGTAVNPLLRAAYLCRKTWEINADADDGGAAAGGGGGGGAGDSARIFNDTYIVANVDTESSHGHRRKQWVTLVVPWLELEEDRLELYGPKNVFATQEEQEDYIRAWLKEEADMVEEADPESGLKIIFYPARYHSGLKSIFAMGDMISLIPDEDGDVCILEEPEHLNWYRAPGEGWTKKFRYSVGIVHTNYVSYASSQYHGLWTAPALGLMSSAMVRAYSHKVIKLSGVLQSFAPEKEVVSNVHGVRSEFLREGQRRAAALESSIDDDSDITRAYFIGKILWAKGLDKMLDMQEFYMQVTGEYFPIDIYGSGPELKEIMRAYHGRRRRKSTVGQGGEDSVTDSNALNSNFNTTDFTESDDDWEDDSVDPDDYDDAVSESSSSDATELSVGNKCKKRKRDRMKKFAKKLKTKADSLDLQFDLPKSRHELRRKPIPATFPGRIDHALLKEQHKIFINPSVTEVLCTTTAEALAMGKFVIIPEHASNKWFEQFPNCLTYSNKWEFAANLRWALAHEPEPLTPDQAYQFSWEAATERFIKAAAITRHEAKERAKLGTTKLDERIAWFHNELGKSDALRKVLGGGPVSNQVKYVMAKKEAEDLSSFDEEDEDADGTQDVKLDGSSLADALSKTLANLMPLSHVNESA